MGYHENISYDKFPKQGHKLHTKVEILFWYDTTRTIIAKVIRDDMEEPFKTMFQLPDGRVVLATECQYHYI